MASNNTVNREIFILKSFHGCPKPRNLSHENYFTTKNSACGALSVVSEWRWLFFDNREMGFLTPRDHSCLPFIPSWAISIVNHEVTEPTTSDKKRGPYKKYSPQEWCQVVHYACDRIQLPQKWTKMCR